MNVNDIQEHKDAAIHDS